MDSRPKSKLSPDQILVIGEALVPPPRFEVGGLIAATYSLDVPAAVGLPLALIRNGEFAGQSLSELSQWPVLEALDRFSGKCRIFCDSGSFYPPRRKHRLLTLLNDIVVPVSHPIRASRRGSFHPKFILVRFDDPDRTETRMRLVCMSRNLTSDTSFDIGVTLEGKLGPRSPAAQNSRGFSTFLESLNDLAVVPEQNGATRDLLSDMAKIVRRTTWQAPRGFDSVALRPRSPGDQEADPARPRDGEDRVLVVSPFLGAKRLEHLLDGLADHPAETKRPKAASTLISEPASLEAVGRRVLSKFDERYEFDPAYAAIAREGPDGSDAGAHQTISGLHAKLFVAEDRKRTRWVVGSGNATSAATEINTEIMIELTGSTRRWGIDALVGDDGIGELLLPAEVDIAPQEEPAAPQDDWAERLLKDLSACLITGEARPARSARYDLAIEIVNPPLVPNEADVTLSLPGRAGSVTFNGSEGGPGVIRDVPLADLPSFLVCRVVTSQLEVERVVPLQLTGIDIEKVRDAARSEEIGDSNPLDYIRFFLTGVGEEADFVLFVGEEQDDPLEKTRAPDDGQEAQERMGPVLEQILDLARREISSGRRDRMQELAAVVRTYRDRLPDDLVDLCAAVDETFTERARRQGHS